MGMNFTATLVQSYFEYKGSVWKFSERNAIGTVRMVQIHTRSVVRGRWETRSISYS